MASLRGSGVGLRAALVALAAIVVVGGCSSDKKSAGGGRHVAITLTDDGCAPQNITTTAGPHTFEVKNTGSAAVTEFEILQGDTIVGEVENVTPGADKSFSLTLKAGTYKTECPNGKKFHEGSIVVGAATATTSAGSAAGDAAVARYIAYVQGEGAQLSSAAAPFVLAVKAGDLAGAQRNFAAARYHYETIEPVAESFGDLDPAIDGREGDVPDAQWGGFHRIEKAAWAGSLAGMVPVADKLAEDIGALRRKIDTLKLEPAQIANGAVELLNEVSTSKISGEEDRYSHTDLSDFAGNVAGAKAAFDALRPLVAERDASLAADIDTRFAAVQQALDAHKVDDPVANGYALYDTLTPDQVKALSAQVDALAEPLSRVGALVVA